MPRRPKVNSEANPDPKPGDDTAAGLAASITHMEVPAFVHAVEAAKAAGTALTTSLEEFATMYPGDPARLADLLFMCLHYAVAENVTVVLVPQPSDRRTDRRWSIARPA